MESPFGGVPNGDVDDLHQFVYNILPVTKFVWSIITFFHTTEPLSSRFTNNILVGLKKF